MGKVAATIFVNEKKEFLFYLRDNKSTISYPGMWALIGGHLDGNETPYEALKREVKEEIDYDIKNPIFLDVVDDKVGNLAYIYKAKIDKKLDELILTEGQKLGFFSFEDAIKLHMPEPLRDFLIKYKNKICGLS